MVEQVDNSLFVAVAFKNGDCDNAWKAVPEQITSRGNKMLVNISRLRALVGVGIEEVYWGLDSGQGIPLVRVERVIERLYDYSLVPTRYTACQAL